MCRADLRLVRDNGEDVVGDSEDTLEALGISEDAHLLVVALDRCGPCGGHGCVFCSWGGKRSQQDVQTWFASREKRYEEERDKLYAHLHRDRKGDTLEDVLKRRVVATKKTSEA
eukprot:TRINITY_DN5931_c0_g1_i3.p2 TRINITY_DN5931_c0_g1~~TRINITY_DN5931_c0_g1_i3.p2  ORF type:complete len:114 (-),score=19.63 TRINITY_DN5931_c0_g1_i3:187-528(-)